MGRELAHLSYQRTSIDSADKSWDCGEIYAEITHGLGVFAEIAAPSRVDDDTRAALKDLLAHTPPCGSASVATGAIYGIAIERGGIEFAFRPGS